MYTSGKQILKIFQQQRTRKKTKNNAY